MSNQRDEVVNFAVGFLDDQKKYQNIKILGSGTFGDVRLMHDPERQSAVAVKIVTSGCISESETLLWPKLKHPNVLPVLECLRLSTPSEAAIYIMPVQRCTLWDVLCRGNLYQQEGDALDQMRGWLHQVLCGLEYLHSMELCHLDIKADNILLSSASVAMLCDFTFLNETTKPLGSRHLGLPLIFRPPEACPTLLLSPDADVDGAAFDVWSYGVMVLEVVTGFQISIHTQECNCWITDLYPLMFHIVQVDTFHKLMAKAFSGCQLKKSISMQALHFVQGFLMVECHKRTSATRGAHHPFLKKGFVMAPPPDPIWMRKVPSDDESCAKFKKRCLQNCHKKYENTCPKVDLPDSEIEEMGWEECSHQNENAHDYQSMPTDGLLQRNDSRDRGEPNRIGSQEDMETERLVTDVVHSGGDMGHKTTRSNVSEIKQSCKTFHLNKSNLQKSTDCDKEGSCTDEKNSDKFNEMTEGAFESDETFKCVREINVSEESPYILEVNMENLTRYMNERHRSKSAALEMKYFPEDLDQIESKVKSLNKDSGAMMEIRPSFCTVDGSKEEGQSSSPSNGLDNLPERCSKGQTQESMKYAVDSYERLPTEKEKAMLSNLVSGNDYGVKDMAAVRHQERQGHMLNDKPMASMNYSDLNSEADTVQKEVHTTDTDLAASGKKGCTSPRKFAGLKARVVDAFGSVRSDSQKSTDSIFEEGIENPAFQDIEVEGKNKTIVGSGNRKAGRLGKVVQWMSKKYFGVVKRRPYKIMKEETL